MADILDTLLEAYRADIVTKKATTFSYIRGVYKIQSPELLPLDWPADLPCVLIYPLILNITPACVPALYMDKKVYRITLSILEDGTGDPQVMFVGDAYHRGVLRMAQDFETIYRRQTFSLTDDAFCVQVDYQPRRIPPISGRLLLNQAHLLFVHNYTDMRSS